MIRNLSTVLAYQSTNVEVVPSIAASHTVSFRRFERDITRIGTGLLGGKVECLAAVSQSIHAASSFQPHLSYDVTVPHMYVIATDFFDTFMKLNGFCVRDLSSLNDEDIRCRFAQAALPGSLVGYLSEILETVRTPIAVRSSGLLETNLYRGGSSPYGAKILPNCHPEFQLRLEELKRAVKAVYASMFFASSRRFVCKYACLGDEKMAVFIQEVFGRKVGRRFFPDLSGKIVSPLRKRGYSIKPAPIVEARPGLSWIDRSGMSISTEDPGFGYWVVDLDSPFNPEDITLQKSFPVSEGASRSEFGADAIDVTCLLEVPVDEILQIAERIVGGRAEILFASVSDADHKGRVRTAVLKVSPAPDYE